RLRRHPLSLHDALPILLPDSVWNDKTTFLDLYCKTGVFLVEIYNRLDEALKKMPAYTDDQVRRTHILNEQLFGLSASDGMPLLRSEEHTSELQSRFDLV